MSQRISILAFVSLFLISCGGGGGSGNGGNGTSTGGVAVSPEQGDFTISTDAINLEATIGDTPAPVQITGNLSNPDSTVFILVDASDSILIKNATVKVDGNSGTLTLYANRAAELPVGTNTGSIIVKACRNASCTSQYSGSPKKINVTYKVNGISFDLSSSDVELKMTANHAFPTPVTVNLKTEKNVGYHGNRSIAPLNEDWLDVKSDWFGMIGTATFSIKKEMPPGVYKRNVDLFVIGEAFKRTVVVTYTVVPEALVVSKKDLSFTIFNELQLPTLASDITVSSNLSDELSWIISSDVNWLDFSANSGNTSDKTSVQVSVNTNYKNLPNGSNKATLTIQDRDKKFDPTVLNAYLYVVDSGTPVTDSVANQFDINITSTAIDAVHGKLYLLESDTKKLFRVDMSSGITEKYYSFDKTPEKLTISADNKKLYISILEKAHNSFLSENQKGYVAILDTETESIQKTLNLTIDPYGIAVTSTGKLLVSGGSAQWTELQSYNVSTGTILGTMSAPVYEKRDIFLDKQEKNLYMMDQSELKKIDVSQTVPVLAKTLNISSVYMTFPARPTPDGKYLITKSGELISTTDLSVTKKLFSSDLNRAQSMWFDEMNSRVIILQELNNLALSIESYRLTDFERTILMPSGFIDYQGGYEKTYLIWLYSGKMYYLYPSENGYKLSSSPI